MRRALEPERESLSLHVTRKQGNPHSRPLTQMTIFGNLRQWDRPRARGRGGVCGGGRGPLGSPKPPGPAAPSPATTFLPSTGCAAGVSAARRTSREGSAAPAPSRASSSSSSWASFPRPPRAPPSKVDVSESTWYRGWRIKSVELNSCHCSDSSRAEHRGSERTSERASGARRGQRERETRTGEAGLSRSGRPGRGAGPVARAPAPGAGPRPSQLEPHGLRDGRRLPSPNQVSEPLFETPAARWPQEVYFQCLF